MSSETMTEYRTYKSEEIVPRPEVEKIIADVKNKPKGVFVLEGDRGAGKTSTLLTLYRYYLQEPGYIPFFIGLFPYSAPEFARQETLWLTDKKFTKEDIPALLQKITRALQIDFIESRDPEYQREYIAKQLANRTGASTPVILVDSIYECAETVRSQIEQDIILPLLASNKVAVLLSGRGKRPNWSSPELRNAEIIKLELPGQEFVCEQLKKMKSRHVGEHQLIARWSGGCPLVVRILGKAEKVSLDVLDQAIDILIRESLSEEGLKSYEEMRATIEKLALLEQTFREGDVLNYLYPNDPEKRTKTARITRLLLESYLLEWDAEGERRGYRLNQTIAWPVKTWLLEQTDERGKQYKLDWENSVEILIKTYPSLDRNDYMKMLAM